MGEFEIKLQVPPARVAEVEDRFATASSQALHAVYFDTPDGALARQQIALRLRREGTDWVQTAKAATRSVLARLEDNRAVEAPGGDGVPPLDLELHRSSPVGARLEEALARHGGLAGARLVTTSEVRVQRKTKLVETERATIEIAFDRGAIHAGERSRDICEVELELRSGDPAEALSLARTWCTDLGVWLSTVSKAERGSLLANGTEFSPPVTGRPLDYEADAKPREVTTRIVAACLTQVMGNASEVAAGSTDPDHIHQLRVGIRRLRTALKDLPTLEAGARAPWDAALVAVFRGLGEHRDRTHVLQTLEPRIRAAGGPVIASDRPADAPEPGALVRSAELQLTLLDLLAIADADGLEIPKKLRKRRRMKKSVRRELSKLHSRALSAGSRFLELDEDSQHRVRKQLKRLRYLTEMVAPLFGKGKAMDFVQKLKPAQETLGTYNDGLIALAAYREAASQQPEALFGVGWLSARREADASACARALRKLGKARPYW